MGFKPFLTDIGEVSLKPIVILPSAIVVAESLLFSQECVKNLWSIVAECLTPLHAGIHPPLDPQLPRADPPPPRFATPDGRYASYWNAFLSTY